MLQPTSEIDKGGEGIGKKRGSRENEGTFVRGGGHPSHEATGAKSQPLAASSTELQMVAGG